MPFKIKWMSQVVSPMVLISTFALHIMNRGVPRVLFVVPVLKSMQACYHDQKMQKRNLAPQPNFECGRSIFLALILILTTFFSHKTAVILVAHAIILFIFPPPTIAPPQPKPNFFICLSLEIKRIQYPIFVILTHTQHERHVDHLPSDLVISSFCPNTNNHLGTHIQFSLPTPIPRSNSSSTQPQRPRRHRMGLHPP